MLSEPRIILSIGLRLIGAVTLGVVFFLPVSSCALVSAEEISADQELEEMRPLSRYVDDDYVVLTMLEGIYNRLARAKDIERLIDFYEEEAVMLPPDGSRIEGREAILSFLNESWPAGHLTDYQSGGYEVASGGWMAYSFGSVEVTAKGPDGENVVTRSSDVHVWVKQEDGSWRIALDIWNGSTE